MTSLDDCPMLTWSLGCTSREPRSPPSNWLARLAMTSLALVLVEVPEPVWKMSSTKCRSSCPSITSCAAATMALPMPSSSWPSDILLRAADCLISPRARMKVRGKRSPLMGKFSTARMVEAP